LPLHAPNNWGEHIGLPLLHSNQDVGQTFRFVKKYSARLKPCPTKMGSPGSPNKLKDRTFRVVFELPNVKKECKALKSKPLRFYRNPIALAQEWQRRLVNGECSSLAALSRKLRVSRARVTQLLRLLRLTPEVLNDLVAIGRSSGFAHRDRTETQAHC